jgi:hypothetical protein
MEQRRGWKEKLSQKFYLNVSTGSYVAKLRYGINKDTFQLEQINLAK